MSDRFPPAREADLVTWAGVFGTKISSAPTTYGLTAAQATLYETTRSAFVASYTTANTPLTRSPANIALKDDAKAALIAQIRLLAGIVQSAPGTTNPMRIELGLPERHLEPTPVPPPAYSPLIEVKSVSGRTARIRLIDTANPTRRGRPAGVDGAAVFSHVGAAPAADISGWKFEGNTGRTTVEVTFPSTVAAGATVWLTAFWFNRSKQSGPACDPVSANLPGGSVSMAA